MNRDRRQWPHPPGPPPRLDATPVSVFPLPAALLIALPLIGLLSGCSLSSPSTPSPGTGRLATLLDDYRLAVDGGPHDHPASARPSEDRAGVSALSPPRTGGVQPFLQPVAPDPAPSPAAHEPADVSLSFSETSLPLLVRAVLGDVLGVPYALDDRIEGTATLVTSQPVRRSEALAMLENVLRLHGAALVQVAGVYHVLPAGDAVRLAAAPPAGGVSGGSRAGHGISIVSPRFLSAAALQRLLEPLYQAAGALQVDPAGNRLLISGTADERRALVEAAQAFDQDWMARRATGVFPLQHARAVALARELTTLMGERTGAGRAGDSDAFQVIPVERLNALLIVASQNRHLERAAHWIRRLDQPDVLARTVHVYPLQYSKARPTARLLSRLFGAATIGDDALPAAILPAPGFGEDTRAGNADPTDSPAPSAGRSDWLTPHRQRNPAPAHSESDSDSGGLPVETPGDGGGTSAGDSVRILADESRNALLILATAEEYHRLESALAALDVPPAQVLIEATIAEVTLNAALNYGVQSFLKGDGIAGENAAGLGFSAVASVQPLATGPGFSAILGALGDPRIILSALDSVTDVKVISSPQVVALDNQEALLKVGDRVPVVTRQAVSAINPDAPLVNSVEFQDTGVILKVLPRINASGVVSMDILQEVSNVSRTTNTGTLTPTISQRRIESRIAVHSGQTVVLGGLIAEDSSEGHDGLPILSEIPVLGAVFGSQSRKNRRTELVVFLTPKVIRNPEDARRTTRDILTRLRSLRPLPQP